MFWKLFSRIILLKHQVYQEYFQTIFLRQNHTVIIAVCLSPSSLQVKQTIVTKVQWYFVYPIPTGVWSSCFSEIQQKLKISHQDNNQGHYTLPKAKQNQKLLGNFGMYINMDQQIKKASLRCLIEDNEEYKSRQRRLQEQYVPFKRYTFILSWEFIRLY